MSAKGQIRIQEMAFMLVAVIFLFVLVGLFFFTVLFFKIKEDAKRIDLEKTTSSIKNLANSPEFYCASSKPNCVDLDKAMALTFNKNYEKFWKFSRLEILKVTAIKKSENELVECTIQNYPNCDRITIFKKPAQNKISISSYVAICRNEIDQGYNYEKCELAKLIAETPLP